ncbi:glycosyltransferase [Oerskovia enterophila]|uniref:Undecaprenyl-phosphate mannosyltransferase n=1 Tax=Oerskovia enterophila TaxID=43678 RepID=A0A163S5C3_9CELL|nr:glycosyltransferase family 2 protein [Oerskovia enterophila]KZM36029.1 undecaprenyl-phosphate mannosyltransferase [Oerskovia enterophila]OCI32359.1 undecaprenyl-phosphate mannosyltransferase [Oerskovia enterophila]
MQVTVVVPTFNEGPNVEELVGRLAVAVEGIDAEVLFVDDSTDDTPVVVARVAGSSSLPVRLLHRDEPVGGLSGAVVEGLGEARGEWVVVMDGDLQHPPEMVPVLLETAASTGADIVVASRYTGNGDAGGLDGRWRHLVSSASSLLARSMFPVRLRNVTDPMTGFFAVRTTAIDVAALRPRGFKILLEILARNKVEVVEEPFVFGERFAGESKATFANGLRYLQQLTALRFGRMSTFALVGAFGAVMNLAIMWGLEQLGVHYMPAAVVSAAVTIVTNFLLLEHFVFHDLRDEGRNVWKRAAQSFTFNGIEAAVRLPFLHWLVVLTGMPPVLAQALTLVVAFLLRFVFHAQVVYRPRKSEPEPVVPLTGEKAAPATDED